MAEHKFPTEVIDLPSQGKVYPKDSPLSDGKIELKYMTTKEEDILMSQNLIKKGVVIDKLIDSLIVTDGVKQDDLILGDKNAVLVAARILAYGPQYTVGVPNPKNPEETIEHTFDLTECPFTKVSEDLDYSGNSFKYTTEVGKNELTFRLLTGKEEKLIEKDIKQLAKYGTESDLTTRLRYIIISVDGNSDQETITSYSQNMLARDSVAFRKYMTDITPDIELEQEIELGGDTVSVAIPLTVEFFWPKSI
tara:strand:+ start:501 stop:1250 length:750 start_codon:yes stop_codon:yes gene_type:complete